MQPKESEIHSLAALGRSLMASEDVASDAQCVQTNMAALNEHWSQLDREVRIMQGEM